MVYHEKNQYVIIAWFYLGSVPIYKRFDVQYVDAHVFVYLTMFRVGVDVLTHSLGGVKD